MGVIRQPAGFVAAVVVSSLALALAASAWWPGWGSASADIALYVRGAKNAGDEPNPAELALRIPPGYTLQEVDYPAGLWPWTGLLTATGATSIRAGVDALDQAIRTAQTQGKVLVIGESLGSLVVDQELRNLAGQADAPDPAQVQFEVIADPNRPGGLISYVPTGWPDPITFTIKQAVPVSQYDVAVVKLQYDGIASTPDRPWFVSSTLNALIGGFAYHRADHYGIAAQDVINGRVPAPDITREVSALDGVTTTYTIQQEPAVIHLLAPRFPKLAEALGKIVTPIVNLGYSALSPNAGPHLSFGGTLVNKNGDPVLSRRHARVAAPSAARPTPAAERRPGVTFGGSATIGR